MFFLLEVFFSPFSPRGASMPTRVGDGHWWVFRIVPTLAPLSNVVSRHFIQMGAFLFDI